MSPKLTDKPNLPPFTNMRVKLATQVFSHIVSIVLVFVGAQSPMFSAMFSWAFLLISCIHHSCFRLNPNDAGQLRGSSTGHGQLHLPTASDSGPTAITTVNNFKKEVFVLLTNIIYPIQINTAEGAADGDCLKDEI